MTAILIGPPSGAASPPSAAAAASLWWWPATGGLRLRSAPAGICGAGAAGGGASGGRDGLTTSSAHSAADLVRARRAGVQIAFLSPAFATASHPGAAGLGPPRWCGLARLHARGMAVAALGGVDGRTVRRLVFCRAVGAIAALAQ